MRDTMKVLLAEDDMLIALDMQMILEDAGHTVLGPVATVRQGEAAASQHPDIAIVDIGLKGGDSGLDLARSLYEASGVPVLFVSGEPSRAEQGRDVAFGYLPKPVLPHDLVAALDATHSLSKGEAAPGAPRSLRVFVH